MAALEGSIGAVLRGGTKEVVEDVDDSTDATFGLPIIVLQLWVERTCKETKQKS